jgi:hypothetical protein
MRRLPSEIVVHGALAGLVAGAFVALWFLVLDLITASAFHTPLVLANTVLGAEHRATDAQLIAGYTILHFGVFAVVGIGTALLLRALGIAPGVLAGIAVGLVVLESVHYGALFLTGADVLAVLPPGNVLAANVFGGIMLTTYLHYALRPEAPFALSILRGHDTLARGLLTGAVGAVAVALWFGLVDLWAGAPFFTAAALGSALFLGAASPAEVQVALGVIAAYLVVHFAVFGAAGIVLDWVAGRLERSPGFWLITVMAFIILGGVFTGMLSLFAGWVVGALGLWLISIGSLIAVLAMGGWLWRTHPTLRHRLLEEPLETRY